MAKLSTIIFGLLFILVLSASAKNVLATGLIELDVVQDEQTSQSCPNVYEKVDVDEDNDTHLEFSESGNKVEVVFNDTDNTLPSEDDRDQVIVNAGAGYEIVNVQYELESGAPWVTVPGNNPTTMISVAGIDDDSRIDEVEVKLKLSCATPTPTLTPAPTNPPSNPGGNGGGDGRSDGLSSCPECTKAPQGQVLGASTMAKAGTFEQNLMNSFAIFGMLLLTAGYKSYAKEKSI